MSITRLIGFVVYCATALLMVALLTVYVNRAIPVMEREYTARYTTMQQEQTRRVQAQEETKRVQSEQWGAAVRTWAWPTAAGVILVVTAVQAGRTLRHWQSERTKLRALLVWYAAHYLPDANVEILPWYGELAIINHDGDGEIIPYGVAEIELSAARLLPG